MFRANSGHEFKGFKICRRCGRWFENTAPGPRHTSPWVVSVAADYELHLAHELVTDILQLRFHECVPPAPKLDNKSFWLSFQAAFINGCSDALGIDPSDLGATFNGWTDESWMGELVIYDRVPGGAGHIDRILDKLDEILTKSLERVEACKGCTDIDSSCDHVTKLIRTNPNGGASVSCSRCELVVGCSARLIQGHGSNASGRATQRHA